jgi:uncharacterized protein (TIGR00156 family)
MKTTLRNVIALGGLVTLSTAALAQYTGPGNRAPQTLPVLNSVADVLKQPVDDQPVELTGTLVRQTGRETFQFRDATGEIQVEIDRDDFPAGQAIGADTRVTLIGEVETRALRAPEIDAESVRLPPAAAAR